MAGIMAGSMASGQITARTGRYKIFPVIGTAPDDRRALLLFHQVASDTPLWQTDIYMAVIGLGLGCACRPLTLAVQNAVPARDMGVATSSVDLLPPDGRHAGVAVFLSLLFSTVGDKIANAFRTVSQTPAFQAALPTRRCWPTRRTSRCWRCCTAPAAARGGVLQDSSFIQRLDPRLAVPFRWASPTPWTWCSSSPRG